MTDAGLLIAGIRATQHILMHGQYDKQHKLKPVPIYVPCTG